jgi:hypothetical protein
MIPVRRAGHRLHVLDRCADRGEHGQRIGLGVERIDGPGGALPVARHGHVVTHARRHGALTGRRCILVLRADLEQRGIGQAARLVARGRLDQVGQDRRPHRVEFGGDRVQQAQVGAAAAEPLGLLERQERPGHDLVHPARGQRPAGQRHAALQGIAHRL